MKSSKIHLKESKCCSPKFKKQLKNPPHRIFVFMKPPDNAIPLNDSKDNKEPRSKKKLCTKSQSSEMFRARGSYNRDDARTHITFAYMRTLFTVKTAPAVGL